VFEVKKNVSLPFRLEQMRLLVDDVASYPDFLESCVAGKVICCLNDIEYHASLSFQKGPFSLTFSTRNCWSVKEQEHCLDMYLLEGPFKNFESQWTFKEEGGQLQSTFLMRFAFSSLLLEKCAGPFFYPFVEHIVASFTARAHHLYGQF
jgi:ribosome-associated toxin RatA of RatAB toxin-antitoxin module